MTPAQGKSNATAFTPGGTMARSYEPAGIGKDSANRDDLTAYLVIQSEDILEVSPILW